MSDFDLFVGVAFGVGMYIGITLGWHLRAHYEKERRRG